MRIGTTLLFQDGYCYQSYGWNMLRPLGALQNALDHLDKYELDEISIIRPVRDNDYSYNKDVQRLTFESYMHKKLVRKDPMAHIKIFFKDMAHLLGMAKV